MDEGARLRMLYQNALVKLQLAFREKNAVAPRKELTDFEVALIELFRSHSVLAKNELCVFWMMGFQTLQVFLRKVFIAKLWTNLSADLLRVSALFYQNLPLHSKALKLSEIVQGLKELLGCLSSVLCCKNSDSPSVLAALKCIEKLVSVILSESLLVKEVYSKDAVHCLGYLVSALLDVFESSDKDNELRVLAGKCLIMIVSCDSVNAAFSLSIILPGTSSRVVKSTFSELHTDVLCLAFDIFTDLIVTTMNDGVFEKEESAGDCGIQKVELPPDIMVTRDLEWFKKTSEHLKQLLDNLCSRYVSHPDYSVRMSVIRCVERIHCHCLKAFGDRIHGTFVDTVVQLLLDPYQKVSEEAKSALNKFWKNSEQYLSARLRERLFSLSSSLRYEADVSSDLSKLVKEISCVLVALGDSKLDSMILIGGKPLKRFIFALTDSIRIDVDRLPVHVSDPSSLPVKNEVPLLYSIQPSDLHMICTCLVKCKRVHVLLEHMLEFILNAQPQELIGLIAFSLFLFENLREELYPNFNDEQVDTFRSFIEQAVNCLQTMVIEEPAEDSFIKREINKNDETSCLAALQLSLCGAAFSCFVSEQLSRQALIETLFEVLQWTASANKLCSSAAEKTLIVITKTLGKEDVSSLCVTYGSYLLTRIAINSQGFSRESRAPLALCSLMNHCNDPALFEHVQHMIPQMLSAIDHSYQDTIIRVLRALLCIVHAMQRWFIGTEPEKIEEVRKGEVNEDEDAFEMEEKKKNHPFVDITIEIMRRTKHLLSSPYLPIRIIVLDILEACTISLRNFYNEILPMLHQNWPGLLSCLRDREIFVQMRAFQVMAVMCRVSKSFLYRRFKEEAWPLVRSFMLSQFKRSSSAAGAYVYSPSYLYQRSVLQLMFPTWKGLSPEESDKSVLTDILRLYCNDSCQPEEFRKLAEEALGKVEAERWSSN